jgi:hypothetical protein
MWLGRGLLINICMNNIILIGHFLLTLGRALDLYKYHKIFSQIDLKEFFELVA